MIFLNTEPLILQLRAYCKFVFVQKKEFGINLFFYFFKYKFSRLVNFLNFDQKYKQFEIYLYFYIPVKNLLRFKNWLFIHIRKIWKSSSPCSEK